jgi:hypothetical protein
MEAELEKLTKPAQVEALTNLALDQVKPSCINPCSLYFILNLCFMFYDCALSLYELYGTVVVLRLTFLFIYINPIIWWNIVSSRYA